MISSIARIKRKGIKFEIMVNLDSALKFKKGEEKGDFLEIDRVFNDSKKGFAASEKDLQDAFSTTDVQEISKIIVKEGEIQFPQEYRDEKRDRKFKQMVEFLSKNAIDPQTKSPIPPERITNAMQQANINVRETPMENQINDIVDSLRKILPITLDTKRVKVIIPAIHTGKTYGVINQYKEKEEWKSDGSLETVLKIPKGALIDFYEKLNSLTHGAAITEEVEEN